MTSPTTPIVSDLVGLNQIAEWLGIKPDTAANYHTQAQRARREGKAKPSHLPPPDGTYGRPPRPMWTKSTLESWAASGGRPGRGAGGGRPWPTTTG